ncbi:hypothetical protein LWI29_026207 [Acer saccharum]|uniref:Uncharacterized protein n=1 Tax=Acer saccharum TaxID=4024 RepID=A0AA39TGV7_ACESA|nr:hypothetical protein LWI29_026207 [Acer saccharum]
MSVSVLNWTRRVYGEEVNKVETVRRLTRSCAGYGVIGSCYRQGAVPNLIGSFTVPKDLTSTPSNLFSGTWKGSKSFLFSRNSSYTLALKMSAELPLSIITRRTSLWASWTPTTITSLGFA